MKYVIHTDKYTFETSETYFWFNRSLAPFTVLSRTEKSITVTDGCRTWRMFVRYVDGWGEYVRDSSVPKSKQNEFTSWASYLCGWQIALSTPVDRWHPAGYNNKHMRRFHHVLR